MIKKASFGVANNLKVSTILKFLLLSLALYFVLVTFSTAFLRVGYKFELEWIEGLMLEQSTFLANTGHLYVEPTMDFVPAIYNPFYTMVAAAGVKLFGSSFLILRAISILSLIGSAILMFLIVKRITRSLWGSLLTLGIFFGSYAESGYWYDLGRVDSLHLFLLLATLACVISRKDSLFYASPVFALLAVMTKQSSVIMIFFVGLMLLLLRFEKGIYFIAITGLLVVASVLLLQFWSNGWYLYYTFSLPAGHAWYWPMLLGYWTDDVMDKYSFSFYALTFLGVYCFLRARQKNYATMITGTWIVSMIALSYISRLHRGGYYNVLIPLHAGLAIAAGLAFGQFYISRQRSKLKKNTMVNLAILCAAIIQLALVFYFPIDQVPTNGDRAYGNKLVTFLKRHNGDVFMSSGSYLKLYAGKGINAHVMSIDDILRSSCGDEAIKSKLKKNMSDSLRTGKYSKVIISSSLLSKDLQEAIDQNYKYSRRLFSPGPNFIPVTGGRVKPELLYRPLGHAQRH